jgi:hypothetical protein
MQRPPPIPSRPKPPRQATSHRDDDPEMSRQFWTFTLVSLCLFGAILLLLLLLLLSNSFDRSGDAGDGLGGGESTSGQQVETEQGGNSGIGSEQPQNEAGSTDTPAQTPPIEAGKEGAELGIAKPNNESSESSAEEAATTEEPSDSESTQDLPPMPSGDEAAQESGGDEKPKENGLELNDLDSEEADSLEPSEESPNTENSDARGAEIGMFSRPEASFFGVKVKAEKVAFVVDASSSMLGPTPESQKLKFERLKEELLRSLKGLSSKQIFTVIMFNDGPILDKSFHQVKAQPKKIKDFENALANAFPGGGTEPTAAVGMMLKEDYDVIFLLSDGEFDPAAVEWIRRENSAHIVICAICLGDDSVTLQKIAKDSGGKYKSVK